MQPKHPFNYSFTTCFKERVIVDMLKPEKGHQVLEMGCGSAYFSTVLEEKFKGLGIKYFGLDLSEEALQAAQRYVVGQGRLVHGGVDAIPFASNTFDRVLYLDVIEHVSNDLLSLQEAYRVLKPGGKLIVSTPNKSALLTDTFFCTYMHDHGHMANEKDGYTVQELSQLLDKSSFKIERVSYTNVFLSELMITATKLGYRVFKSDYGSQADMIEVSETALFKFFKTFVFPIGYAVGRLEEILFSRWFAGHCLIITATKQG